MKTFYSVVLFGNRKGATINKDYAVATCSSYKEARDLIKTNGNWGNVKEYNSYYDALGETNDFSLEVMGQGLSVATLKH